MSVKSEILNGTGRDVFAAVGDSHALLVQELPLTSKNIDPANLNNIRTWREFFLDAAGSSSQVVNGSVTPVEFLVRSSINITKWVTGFRLNIESQNVFLNSVEFRSYGATGFPGLTNGIQIEAVQSGITTSLSVDPIRTLGDYVNYANSTTNLTNVISSTMDYIQFTFTFETPVVLIAGSQDQIIIRIRDNLTTALTSGGVPAGVPAAQNAVAFGYQESV